MTRLYACHPAELSLMPNEEIPDEPVSVKAGPVTRRSEEEGEIARRLKLPGVAADPIMPSYCAGSPGFPERRRMGWSVNDKVML